MWLSYKMAAKAEGAADTGATVTSVAEESDHGKVKEEDEDTKEAKRVAISGLLTKLEEDSEILSEF